MLRMTLRMAYRRTVRSLLVNPPSLKTGSWNRLVVTIGTTIPVSSRVRRNSLMIRSRSWALLPGGIKSSSWKVIPYAPISANRVTASTVARTGRVASPNRSRACQPTVQSPKLNLSSRVGLRSMSSRVSADVMTTPQLRALHAGYTRLPAALRSPWSQSLQTHRVGTRPVVRGSTFRPGSVAGRLSRGSSAFDRTGEPADDAAFEQAEEHQSRNHRQRGEREHLCGVDRVLRREGLHAEGQGKGVLVVQDEQRQQVAIPGPDERQDAGGDHARH